MIRLPRILLALCLSLAGQIAPAQSSLDQIVRLEVLDGGQRADGMHWAALHLRMAPGWKTYWRAPGDAGIPPLFIWSGSRNLASARVVWPSPVVFDQGGLRSVGYADELVLPVEITPRAPNRPVHLGGRISIGVCSDVCVPATLEFDQSLEPGAPRNPAIVAALAARPYSAAEAGVGRVVCRIRPIPDGLEVTAEITMPPAGGQEFAVFEAPDPGVWSSEAKTSRQGGVLVATSDLLRSDGAPLALDRSALRITVLGSQRAVDIRGCSAD